MIFNRRWKSIISALILILLLTGCSSSQPDPQASADAVIIRQTGAADWEFTLEQIKAFAPVERDVEAISSSGEVTPYHAKGALLADVLQAMGLSQTSLDSIRLVAGDGYSIEVGKEVLVSREIILAYEMDGAPLPAESQPMRVIIPQERAMYWVRNLVRIEILQTAAPVAVSEIYVLETVTAGLEKTDYLYEGTTEQTVAMDDLVFWLRAHQPAIRIVSLDGLTKNESWENLFKGVIMTTGSDAPAYVGEDLPKGMHVKKILWMTLDQLGYVSVINAQLKFAPVSAAGITGVALSEVLENIGFSEDVGILLTAADGYTVEISHADIAKGIMYMNSDGKACVMFAGLPGNTHVKEIQKIEAVE